MVKKSFIFVLFFVFLFGAGLLAQQKLVSNSEREQLSDLEKKYRKSKFETGICYLHSSQLIEQKVPYEELMAQPLPIKREEELAMFPFAAENTAGAKVISDVRTGLPAYVLVRVCRSCVEAKKKWTEEQKVKQAAQQAAEKKENQK